ncbi:MAG: peptidylprolyl isomerase [Planctomycetota bacterium]
MKRLTRPAFALLALGLFACGQTTGQADESTGPDTGADGDAAAVAQADLEVLTDPSHEAMNQTAPDAYDVLFHTTAGDFTVHVTRDWAPKGADRFYNLVVNGFFNGTYFFRVVPGFVVQWGVHGDPAVTEAWDEAEEGNIEDDPVRQSNTRGRITFANAGPDTRSTQVFINFGNNARLDDPRAMRGSVFAPFGEVVGDGMDVVDALYDEYPVLDYQRFFDPETAVSQGDLMEKGNAYLEEFFPELDHIISATIVEADEEDADAGDDATEEDAAE